ncbi:LamG-like jellyroll fold domain-containing protein [Tessaracoccus lacteus]|uniref:DNRLRE domain-containing protein n=1 Tax=Tessaracoccus lacteus TaxID=3041766 RepID=A0ABY8PW73_9ACTN|nr:LamG-like jellyroll fold domain-containing protein [Tessaracoccus sp. T21]WGT46727.1 DNRLRE domain-containing protein [Tessaracoccus sp. T21]
MNNSAEALSPGVSFGSVDQPTWQTNGVVYALGSAQGKVFAGGSFTQLRPPSGGSGTAQSRAGLAVLDAATGAPTSCQFTVSGLSSTIRAIEVTPDQSTVYIAGAFTSVNGVSRTRVAALDVASCSVKTAFNAGVVSAEVFGLDVYNNTLYLAGGFSTVRDETRQYYAAVNATTGALLPWTANGVSYSGAGVNKRGRAVQVSPDGQKVVLGGYFYYVNGEFSHSIAMLSSADSSEPNGTLLRTYPRGFIPGDPNATSPDANAPQGTSATHAITNGAGDGMFYIANEGIGGGVFDGRAAFRWSDGEQVWRDTCLGATQDLIEDNGTIYSVNHQHDCSGINFNQDGRRVYLAAQNSQTMEHYGWKPDLNDGTGEGIGPRALDIAVSGSTRYLWVGGEFTRVNGSAQQGLTRFTDASSAPSTPTFVGKAMDNGTIQVTFRTSTDNDDSHLTYRVYRNGSTTPIWEGTAISYWWKRPQVTFVDSNVTAGTLYTYRVEVTDGTTTRTSGSVGTRAIAATDSYQRTIKADSPSLYWTSAYTGTSTTSNAGSWVIDSAANTTDTSAKNGLGMMGLTPNSEGITAADTSGSFTFDGVDDYIWNDQLSEATSTYTLETWIKTTTTRGGKIIGFGNGRPNTGNNATSLSGNYDRQIYMLNNGQLRFGVWTGSATALTTSTSYNDGAWHHIVATQGADGMSLWVDGNRVAKNTNTAAQAYWGVWHVGGDNLSGWPDRPASNFFAGQIDETAVYDTVLSKTQIAAHATAGGKTPDVNASPSDAYGASVYAADPDIYWRLDDTTSAARDSSYFGQATGQYNTGVTHPVAGALGSVNGAPNTGAQFNGTDSATVSTTVSQSPSNPFTLQLWFNAPSNGRGKLVGFENTTTGNGSAYDKMVYMTDAGRLVFGVYNGATDTVFSTASYNDATWHQLTVTQDSSGMKMYVDGALVGSRSVSTAETGAGYWRIGGGNISGWPDQPSNFYFNGAIDEFAVYSKALQASTIQSQYGTVNPDGQAPTAPGGLSGSYDSGAAQLTWTASSDNLAVTGYRIYRGTTSDFTADASSQIGTATALSYADSTATAGTWYYKVAAVDAAGNVSTASAAASVEVPDTTAPDAPSLTATVSVVTNTPAPGDTTPDITLAWDEVTDNVATTSYALYRGTTADFTPSDSSLVTTVTVTDASQTSYTHVVPNPEQGTWYYRLVALDAAGNASEPSAAAEADVPDTAAPTAPADLSATVVSGSVQLSWTASTDNVAVTGYQIHRSADPSFTPAAATLVGESTTTSYTDAAPAGSWHYTVVAVDAAGNTSTASGVADATVADTLAPSTPTLSAEVDGDSIELSWTESTDNTAVTGYRVYRGTTADFTPDTANLIDETTSRTLTDDDLDPGTYHYKVVAFDEAGNVSAASEAATATVAAPDTTAPTAPTVAATVSGDDVSLTWTGTSTDDTGVVGYTLYRGTTDGFTPGSSTKVADLTGTTYTDNNLDVGTYYYKVTAVDAAGNVSDPSETASATVAAAPVDPVTLDVAITDDAGVVQTAATTNYGSNTQLFSRGSSAQQSFIRLDLPSAPSGTSLASATLKLRTSADPAAASADIHSIDLVSGSWTEGGVTWNNRPTTSLGNVGSIAPVSSTNTAFTVTLNADLLAQHLGESVTIRISGEGTDNLRLFSSEYSTASSRPALSLTFDSGTVADTTAPSAPSGVSATVTDDTVALTWGASTDNVGVIGYEVYRGSASDFTANSSSRIGTVTSRSYSDEDLAAGTYYYKVKAKDAAGNLSDASSAATAEVEEPSTTPDPVSLQVGASADAAVVSTAATTNYGSNNQAFSSNASSVQQTYLQFDVPEVPASGLSLTGVQLRLRTSVDGAAGSTGTHDVNVVTGSWTEGALNWNNRPTTVGAKVCEISSATSTNTLYTVTCDPAAFTPGSTVTLRISTTSTDNLRIFTKEYNSSLNYRPSLLLDYTAD